MSWSDSLRGHLDLINARLIRIENTIAPRDGSDLITGIQYELPLLAFPSVDKTDHPIFSVTKAFS